MDDSDNWGVIALAVVGGLAALFGVSRAISKQEERNDKMRKIVDDHNERQVSLSEALNELCRYQEEENKRKEALREKEVSVQKARQEAEIAYRAYEDQRGVVDRFEKKLEQANRSENILKQELKILPRGTILFEEKQLMVQQISRMICKWREMLAEARKELERSYLHYKALKMNVLNLES